jgi:hypothetical protein
MIRTVSADKKTFSVYGYHGTSRINAESILREGFNTSNRGYDWLGSGAYFWQDAPKRALDWAKIHHPKDPVVIRSLITFEENKTIDLLDTQWHSFLSTHYTSFVNECIKSSIPLPTQNPSESKRHTLDHAFLDYISLVLNNHPKRTVKISVIRAAFTEGSPVFPSSAIHDLSHVQIAVKDNEFIKDSIIFDGFK